MPIHLYRKVDRASFKTCLYGRVDFTEKKKQKTKNTSQSVKTFMSEITIDILSNFQEKSVEEIWSVFISYFDSGITVIPVKSLSVKKELPASILYKSIAGRYRPVSYPYGPITAHYSFIKNAYWKSTLETQEIKRLIRKLEGTYQNQITVRYSIKGRQFFRHAFCQK